MQLFIADQIDGLFCCGSLLAILALVVYFAAKLGTQSALREQAQGPAEGPPPVIVDQVERAMHELLMNETAGAFVIVQRVLGKEFVQFVRIGPGQELMIEMPVPERDAAMAWRAESAFAKLGGWQKDGKHQAKLGYDAGRMAILARQLLTDVYGLPANTPLGVTRGTRWSQSDQS